MIVVGLDFELLACEIAEDIKEMGFTPHEWISLELEAECRATYALNDESNDIQMVYSID